jgi:hypothetical protein
MTSRERVETALAHREPDRVPLDLGSTTVTGMHVSTVYRLRQALGLDRPGTPVKVTEIYQMLGEIGLDLLDVLGVDAVGVRPRGTRFGFPADGWKEWRLFDGTPVLVPGLFNTTPDENGDILQYPMGDTPCHAHRYLSARRETGPWTFLAQSRACVLLDGRRWHSGAGNWQSQPAGDAHGSQEAVAASAKLSLEKLTVLSLIVEELR